MSENKKVRAFMSKSINNTLKTFKIAGNIPKRIKIGDLLALHFKCAEIEHKTEKQIFLKILKVCYINHGLLLMKWLTI